MTWHTYNNYGSLLQAYALRKKLEFMGYRNVDLIDYLPKYTDKNLVQRLKKKNIFNKVLSTTKKISDIQEDIDKNFNEFRKNFFTYTKSARTSSELYLLNNEYDKFICGSDQIWSPTPIDENYFLKFVSNNSKKISYAPSIGISAISNDEIKRTMGKLISEFSAVSIREEKGRDIIKDICGLDAKIVLDPTLLLSKEEWKNIFSLDDFKKNNYILIYSLGDTDKAYKLAKKMLKKGQKIIIISNNYIDCFKYKDMFCKATPIEFLKLIYNAALVITDSFHGTIFSMNFNVPFITVKRFKDDKLSQNSRIYSILNIMECSNRLYKNNVHYFRTNLNIDFSMINKNIEKYRKESIDFLKNAIETPNTFVDDTRITNSCCGCGLCAIVCPKKCINIMQNDSGFYEYAINSDKCVNCGKCKNVCAQVHSEKKCLKNFELYSAYSLNTETLLSSSSGGLAKEISLYGLENDYKIIGCEYDYKNNIAHHTVVENIEDLKKISGSKYLQSYTIDAFKMLQDIEKGIIVGTPCQIASIDNYLKMLNIRENFILIDLICHGVPSNLLWNKFIYEQGDIEKIEFRNKQNSWRKKTMKINNKLLNENNCLFYDFFSLGNVYNNSCYECNYRDASCADIRLGDYWGEKFKKNKLGVNMVLIGSTQGKKIIKKLANQNRIFLRKESIDDYYSVQQNVNYSAPNERILILNDLKRDKLTLKSISNKYCRTIKWERAILEKLSCIYRLIKGVVNGK